MESKTKKYKIYLIILTIFAIISFIIGYLFYLELCNIKESIDEVYATIINGSDEEKEETLEQFNSDIEDEDSKYTYENLIEYLEQYQKGETYIALDEGNDQEVISILSMEILSVFNGYMLIVVFINYLLKRFLKGLNKALRIIFEVIVAIFIYPACYYIMALGSITLPIVIIYCIYKIIKGRNKGSSDEVKEVLGKVDEDVNFDDNKEDEK